MKKFLLLFLLIPSLCFAQVQEDAVFEFNDFSGLLKSQINPYIMPSNSAVQARNLRANELFGGLSKRQAMLEYGAAGAYAIESLYRYYKSDDTKYLIATGSTLMLLGDDDAGTWQTIRDELSSGKKWQFITYKDMMIGVNGTDRPQKYDGSSQITANTDGSRSAGILTTDLGAPFAELNTGANLDASSWYQYKIAYYDGSIYYWSDARSNPLLTGSSVQDITLTDIPPGPVGTTQRIIYRTVGNASRAAAEADTSFYRVATISDNTTTTYDDAITDATILGDSAPTWATVSAGTEVTVPIAKYIALHKERVWLANVSGGLSDIYWSHSFLPNYFKINTDFDQIRPDDGDQITFMRNLLGLLVIGKTNTIQKYRTDTTSSLLWAATDPFSFIGCPAPYSVVDSRLGIIYLGRDGIYVFNGERSELISDVVTDKVRDISQADIVDTVGVFFDNEYQLAYTSASGSAGQNDSVLVFDIVRDAYVVDDKDVSSFAVLSSGSDFGSVYSGSSLTDGKVFIHDNTPSQWIHRYKSDLESGTNDSTITYGTENVPFIELAWGVTIDTVTLAGVTLDSATISSATVDRKDTTGYWYSDIVKINASTLEEMKWNEDLGSSGDVTFAIRVGVNEAATEAASWSSEFTNPNNSDISSVSGDVYIQIRGALTTTDITQTPLLFSQDAFVVKVVYNKEGDASESNILTVWESGWQNFGRSFNKKKLKRIEFHYTGTSGTLNVQIDNSEGDILQTFDIDLSVNPGDSDSDLYIGNNTNKIFIYEPPLNSFTDPSLIGEFWKFSVTEDGIVPWKILRIKFKYDVEELYE